MADRLAILASASFRRFILENEDADVARLLLSKKRPQAELKEAADQIMSRKKAKDKLPSWFAQEQLVFPPPLSIEQASSEKTAAYKHRLLSGKKLVDLSGGTGIDCLGLAKGFEEITYVEQNPWLCELFQYNAKILSQHIAVVNDSANTFLKGFEGRASFFVDPARRDQQKKKVFQFEDCSPNVLVMLPELQQKAEGVLIKAAPMIDLTRGIEQLKFVSEVHVVSVLNECKEVLFKLDFEHVGEPTIHCVNLTGDSEDLFSFTFKKEKASTVDFASASKYVYEPNASIRKAGAFKLIAKTFKLKKIAPNTHLYTSDKLNKKFPGRIFEVLQSSFEKGDFYELFPDGKANVISKNHPRTPEEIKKKYKLKDGGDHFLIAYRDAEDKSRMIVATLPVVA